MRLYEDDGEEVRPSFSFGDEDNAASKPNVVEDFGRHYEEEERPGSHDSVSRIQTRLNIVSVLIPAVLVVIMLVIYFQIKGELTSIQSSGTNEIKTLSLELQTKVTDLENRLNTLEQKINSDLEANGNNIKEIKAIAQSKADKKDFDALSTQANARLDQIQKSASETATAAADKIKKDVDASVGQMQKNVDSAVKSVSDMEKNLGPEIETLKGSVSEANSIAKSAQKEASALKSSGFATKDDISRETSGIESRLRDLEQKIAKLSKGSGAAATSVPATKSAKSATTNNKTQPAKEKVVKSAPAPAQDEPDYYEEPAPDVEEDQAPAETPKPAAKEPSKPAKSKGGISEQNL